VRESFREVVIRSEEKERKRERWCQRKLKGGKVGRRKSE
jgi:hypothetical protein